MAYRMRVNDKQLFGNNICYDKWISYLISKGIEIDEDGCFDGYLDDFNEALGVIEEIVMGMESERDNQIAAKVPGAKSLFDLSDIKATVTEDKKPKGEIRENLFDQLHERIKYGFLFLPVMFYEYCRDMLEYDPEHTSQHHRLYGYRLKPGCRIHVHGG